MRRKAEDMMATRTSILDEAFKMFFDRGYDTTSLEDVAKNAGVTRGAIYWHFKDKEALYRAVIDYILPKGDVARYGRELPLDMPYKQKIEEVFLWALKDENTYVDFVYKTLNFTYGHPVFNDIFESVKYKKRQLMDFFLEETRIHFRLNGIAERDTEDTATEIYLLFEGMFLTKNVPIGISLSREDIIRHVDISLRDI